MKTSVHEPRLPRLTLLAAAVALMPFCALAQQAAQQGQAAPASGQTAATARVGGAGSYERQFPAIASGKWTGARTADGQPDIAGHWSNTIANHSNFTDPNGGAPGERGANARPLPPRSERAPSRVSDPADGQVPFQPWAAEKVKEFQKYFTNPIEPQYIEPLARCAPAGVPKSLYWHGYEIRQYPGYVVFLFGSGTRIIHLDGKPHLPDNIKLWNADSRGHWEGNTLVVDVTNNNGKALFGRTGEFSSENVHVTERYIFDPSNQRYNYVAEFVDPTVYTRPFTVTIPAKRWTLDDKPSGWHFEGKLAVAADGSKHTDRYERVCAENNGGFGVVADATRDAAVNRK